MKTTLLYRDDNLALPEEIVCDVFAPGLLIGHNPRRGEIKQSLTYKRRYAIFHESSALIAGTCATKKRAREACAELVKICVWNVTRDALFASDRNMRIACRLMRRFATEATPCAEIVTDIVADLEKSAKPKRGRNRQTA